MARRGGTVLAPSPADLFDLRGYAGAVDRRLAALSSSRFIEKMYRGDPGAWSRDPAARRVIRNRLGWLRAPDLMLHEVPRLLKFAGRAREEGMRRVVVCGMGGSSLCVEVFGRVLARARGFLPVDILDTTVPEAIRRVESRIDPKTTLFVISSKSGTTLETACLQSYFWGKMRRFLGRLAARHFVAITDPGTPLAAEAAAYGYRATFLNPPDIGGRYSALSYFGMVPAVLGGADIAVLLSRARAMLKRCGPGTPPSDNPGLKLGAALGVLARRGRDKVVLTADPALKPYIGWIEQLLAESTGKKGKGLVPVDAPEEPATKAATLAGPDRVAVALTLPRGRGAPPPGRRGRPGGTPAIELRLADRLDIGASMLQWEIATATAAAVLGVNPFDEPNVAESKKNTEAALLEFEATGRFSEEPPALLIGRTTRVFLGGVHPPRSRRATLASALKSLLASLRRGDYLAVLAYVDPGSRPYGRALRAIRSLLVSRTPAAVTVGYGPRYLHSTGQLHKGGPGTGVFIEIVRKDRNVLPIPGRLYDFQTLKQAQALGDYVALKRRGRRILRLRSEGSVSGVLRLLAAALRRTRA